MNELARSGLKGAAAGVAGCVAMDILSAAWSLAQHGHVDSMTQQGGRPDVAEARDDGALDEEVATVKLAKSKAGGTTLHYLFGAGTGAAYSLAAEHSKLIRTGAGVPFGLAVWAVAVQGSICTAQGGSHASAGRIPGAPPRLQPPLPRGIRRCARS